METAMDRDTYAIRHRIEIDAPRSAVYDALATRAGLAAWWTTRVEAEPEEGAIVRLRFGDGNSGANMRIDALVPDECVLWTCVEGPWKGMRFRFTIGAHERGAVLSFANDGWPDTADFYQHCNSKWGFFLVASLKSYVEGSNGIPHPYEPRI